MAEVSEPKYTIPVHAWVGYLIAASGVASVLYAVLKQKNSEGRMLNRIGLPLTRKKSKHGKVTDKQDLGVSPCTPTPTIFSLRLFHPNIDPAEITHVLALKPENAHGKLVIPGKPPKELRLMASIVKNY